jgi:lysophospholipase L1-like esterase
MKKIRVIVSLILVFAFSLGVYSLFKKEDYCYYLVMGDYISNKQVLDSEEIASFSSFLGDYLVSEKKINEVSNGYLKNNMTSKKMLEMIENDSYTLDGTSLVSRIKKSKYITITLGINDIINNVKYDSLKDELIYDKEIIANKIEIFKHNYYQIVEEIKDINSDCIILLVGCYPLYGDEEIALSVSEAIKSVASCDNCFFVDLSNLTDRYMYNDNELYLTSLGQEEVSKKIISIIKEFAI